MLVFLPSLLIPGSSAEKILDKTFLKYGGDRYNHVLITFDFRDKHYRALRQKDGVYRYERHFIQNGDSIRDVLYNDGFRRIVNGQEVSLEEKKRLAFGNSVNSVIYFALLPHGLNDQGLRKEYLGEVKIGKERYHKIRVDFKEVESEKDHHDVFIYWIHTKTASMDYFAYQFFTEEGGFRFRSAYNHREVNGIVFQDYINYKPEQDDVALETLDSLYNAGKLKELSRITLSNISVTPL